MNSVNRSTADRAILARIDRLQEDKATNTRRIENDRRNGKKVANQIANINDNLLKELEQAKSTLSDLLTDKGETVKSPAPLPDQLSAIRKKISDLEVKGCAEARYGAAAAAARAA